MVTRRGRAVSSRGTKCTASGEKAAMDRDIAEHRRTYVGTWPSRDRRIMAGQLCQDEFRMSHIRQTCYLRGQLQPMKDDR